MQDQTRAAVLTPAKIRHLLNVTEATSRHPERDAAILLLGLCCGMRCTETAQITVADIMFPSGKLRNEVSLRAKITKGCKQRCIYASSPKLIAALERYIEFRWTNRIGVFPDRTDAQYRGLRPDLPLFITRKGAKFELNTTRSGAPSRLASGATIWPLTAYRATSRACTPRPASRAAAAIAAGARSLPGCTQRPRT